MKKYLLISLSLIAMSCSTNTPVPEVIKHDPIVLPPQVGIAEIVSIAGTSGISKYKFKERGLAPLGFLKGIALAYAQELCKPSTLPSTWKNSPETDALIYYKIDGNTSLNTYAFLIGLGMRESSGKYCEGRDLSARNTSSTNAEAGMFQTSFNAGTAKSLMENYSDKCFLEVFQEGVNQSRCDYKNYGSGIGFEFQKKTKECPTFAVKVAANTIRVLRKHYGPINRKEAEFRPEALEMLTQVKKVVENNPSICSLL